MIASYCGASSALPVAGLHWLSGGRDVIRVSSVLIMVSYRWAGVICKGGRSAGGTCPWVWLREKVNRGTVPEGMLSGVRQGLPTVPKISPRDNANQAWPTTPHSVSSVTRSGRSCVTFADIDLATA